MWSSEFDHYILKVSVLVPDFCTYFVVAITMLLLLFANPPFFCYNTSEIHHNFEVAKYLRVSKIVIDINKTFT